MEIMQKLYLSGAFNETEYREYCKNKYSKFFEFIDPISYNSCVFEKFGVSRQDVFDGKHPSIMKEIIECIVENDKELIDNCDGVIVYIRQKSFGTIMEIMYAFMKNKPIYVITSEPQFVHDFWLSYHATKIFPNIDSCLNAIINFEGQSC